tara:strand:+ start:265 stop:1719 length:1455 start_codon:yes stop_codon:yes gene_type:complete
MPTILGAGDQTSGYEISNSLRFNAPDSASLKKTNGSAGNQQTMTFSFWVKRSIIAEDFGGGGIFGCGTADGNEWNWTFRSNVMDIRWEMTDGTQGDIRTSPKNRDVSGWTNFVLALDTTSGTTANRIRFYQDGSEITAFDEAAYPGQNKNFKINGTVEQEIGRFPRSDKTLIGYLADFYFIDGSALTPASFGETNNEGIWIPKDAKDDLTFGTNGYFLEFKQTGTSANSSGMGADTSGNDNHWTPSNLESHDVTTDTPTNNFCTLNTNFRSNMTCVEGATKLANGTDNNTMIATQHSRAGYFEAKYGGVALSNGAGFRVGIVSWDDHYGRDGDGTSLTYNSTGDLFWLNNTDSSQYRKHTPNTTTNLGTSKWNAPTTSDIVGVAWRIDSPNGIWFAVNGTWYNGSGSASTTLDESNPDFTINDKFYIPIIISSLTGGNDCVMNFGNPPYSNSSSNSDAGGYGDFEYAVPDGFYALNTKNLAKYG